MGTQLAQPLFLDDCERLRSDGLIGTYRIGVPVTEAVSAPGTTSAIKTHK
jgi:hypothetical protein